MKRIFIGGFAAAILVSSAWAKTFDLATSNVAEINEAFDAGALTSEKLVKLYLARIEAYDKQGPKVNCVITLNPKALEQARALDAERKSKGPRSPLHGIPIVLKDLIDVAGLPTTAGFTPFGAPVPLRDSTIVARMHAVGAIMLAKVSTTNWFGTGFRIRIRLEKVSTRTTFRFLPEDRATVPESRSRAILPRSASAQIRAFRFKVLRPIVVLLVSLALMG